MSFVLIKQGKLVTVVLFGTKLNVTELLRNLAKWIAQSLIQDQRSHYVLGKSWPTIRHLNWKMIPFKWHHLQCKFTSGKWKIRSKTIKGFKRKKIINNWKMDKYLFSIIIHKVLDGKIFIITDWMPTPTIHLIWFFFRPAQNGAHQPMRSTDSRSAPAPAGIGDRWMHSIAQRQPIKQFTQQQKRKNNAIIFAIISYPAFAQMRFRFALIHRLTRSVRSEWI